MAASTVEFIESAFPLLVVRLPHSMTSPELHVLFAGFERIQRRAREEQASYFVVVDALALAKLPSPLERKMLTDWMSDPTRTEIETRYSLGSAVAMASRPVRAVLTALNWIRRPPKPQVLVESVTEAIDVAIKCLQEANLPISAAMQTLRAQEHARTRLQRR